jgi:hypothetical protein
VLGALLHHHFLALDGGFLAGTAIGAGGEEARTQNRPSSIMPPMRSTTASQDTWKNS